VTDLARLDGPATASVGGQLAAVYRAAMSAEPFSETEVPPEGWYGRLRAAVGDGAGEWLEDQFAVVWIAGHLYRSLGFRELGHGPLGWHDADRLVLGADLRTGSAQPDPPASGPPVGEATSPAG
jgi:hypothetical protein